ncbi:Serine-rich protein-related [Rhynchospora pubera]|uniref:Serine-rich protein-related n=1 Tax=Rhynchospora pubera TaxID=906938 RepID=A0AAV8HL86_9POAL|nr:Serine-rich protein-related [Rhynchospora pubera]
MATFNKSTPYSLPKKTTTTTNPSSTKSQTSPRTCLCSPTNHPGSFRCSRHRNIRRVSSRSSSTSNSSSPSRAELIKAGRKAKSVKTILMLIISPSCRDLHRRRNFRPMPSRFCQMNYNSVRCT